MDRNYAYHIVIGINCLIRRFRHCLYNNYDMLEDNKTMEIVYKDFLKFIVQPCTTSSNRPSCYIDVMLLNNNYNPYLRVDIVTAQLIDINHLNEDIETKKRFFTNWKVGRNTLFRLKKHTRQFNTRIV